MSQKRFLERFGNLTNVKRFSEFTSCSFLYEDMISQRKPGEVPAQCYSAGTR